MRRERWWGALAASTILAACGGSSSHPPVDTTGGTSSGGPGASSGGAASGFVVQGTMSDAQTGTPLASVSVCLLSAPGTCATTDGSGAFSLSGVQGAGDGFRGSLASYVTGIWPESPTGTTTFNVELRPTTLIASLAKAAGATWDGTTGAVLFFVEDGSGNGLPGAQVALSTGGKIAYFNTNGSLDAQLTATMTNGSGYAFELAAGATNISVTVTGKTCRRAGADGWTPTVSGAVLAGPIVIGQLTKLHVACQ